MAQCNGEVADAIQIPRLNDSGAPQLLHIGHVNAAAVDHLFKRLSALFEAIKEIFHSPAAAIGIVTR